MKRFVICLVYSIIIFTSQALPSVLIASDVLIEPTRTITETSEQPAKLSVFSEPPELQVILDGTPIGKTPVVEKEVKPGIHVIRIKDSENEIDVKSDKLVQYSWVKGTFIRIPDSTRTSISTQAEKEKLPPKQKSEEPKENKEELDPFYWPLNPRGPIN